MPNKEQLIFEAHICLEWGGTQHTIYEIEKQAICFLKDSHWIATAARISISQWLYVLVQTVAVVGRRIFSYSILSRQCACVCVYECVCVFVYVWMWTSKEQITDTNTKPTWVFYKMFGNENFKHSRSLSNALPIQAIAWNAMRYLLFFSTSCFEFEPTRNWVFDGVLHNVGKRSQCQCMRTSTETFRFVGFVVSILVDNTNKKRLSHTIFGNQLIFWSPFNED